MKFYVLQKFSKINHCYLGGIAELLNSNLAVRCRLLPLLLPLLLLIIILVLLPPQENNPECLSLLHSLNPKLLTVTR